jgi:hypothetical protein
LQPHARSARHRPRRHGRRRILLPMAFSQAGSIAHGG